MGLCIGGNWCRKQECKNRCEGWFGNMPDVAESCKGACKGGNTSFSKDEYLCSGQYIDIGPVMLRYNTDPCLDDDLSLQQLLDPLDTHNAESRRIKSYTPILIGAAVVFIIILLLIPTKK